MSYLLATANVERIPLADKSVDLVIGSPPYMDARTYGIGAQRGCVEWVEWMLGVTTEALRVSRGAVVWVMAGVTRDRNYWPGCEGLAYEWFRRGGHAYRPCYWHRVGVPGSGGDQWFRADVEYAMAFKRPGKLPWTDNTACGHPPKCAPGGAMANRLSDGHRVNQKGRLPDKAMTGRDTDGPRRIRGYYAPALANPGNLIQESSPESQLAFTIETYTQVAGSDFDELLRSMRKAATEEDLPRWWCRVFARIQGEAILRSNLQRLGIEVAGRPETGRPPASGSQNRSEENDPGCVRPVRFDAEVGNSSQGWGCDQQRSREPGMPVHDLPPIGTQAFGLLGGRMLEALHGDGLLLHALLAFQEVRKSFDEMFREGQAQVGGDLIQVPVGGGQMGSTFSHINEAPYPEGVPEFFVKSLCPPAGLVLDPFGGSGTTASVAARSGRVGLSFDLRPGQADLARRRIEDQLQAAARPHAPRPGKPKVARPAGQASFLDRLPGEAEAR